MRGSRGLAANMNEPIALPNPSDGSSGRKTAYHMQRIDSIPLALIADGPGCHQALDFVTLPLIRARAPCNTGRPSLVVCLDQVGDAAVGLIKGPLKPGKDGEEAPT